MAPSDWDVTECCLEGWAFKKLPESVQDALRGRYGFTVMAWDVIERQAVMIPPQMTSASIIVARGILDEHDDKERLRVLFHEFAHVYLKHGCPKKENAEQEARELADLWLDLWRDREAASA